MQITDYLVQYANSIANGTSAAAQTSQAASTQTVGMDLAGQLQEGSIFEGSINALDGSKVILGLSNGQTIPARLEGNLSLLLGESLFFQVKSNDGNTISIRPYMNEGTMNPAIQKALEAAGMEMTEETVDLVNRMMQEGLSIDKNSLHMMRQVLFQTPGVPLSTLAEMSRYGIPLNSQMATQFQNYQMDQHEMLSQMNKVMNELPQVFDSAELDAGQLKQLNAQILSIIEEGMPQPEDGETQLFTDSARQGQAEPEAALSESKAGMPQPEKEGETLGSNGRPLMGAETADARKTLDVKQNVPENKELARQAADTLIQTKTASDSGLILKERPVAQILDRPQMQHLEQQLKQLFPENENLKLNENLSARQLLDQVLAQLERHSGIDRDTLGKLFSGKEYHALLKDVMEQQWTVTPEELKSEHKVEELYERLNKQMGQLEHLAKQTGLASNQLSESVSQVRNNIDFMNQLNQAYTYVQIPLKLANQNAHSDLYVYTNKRNLREKEGELSAFLHLDLDNLGSTDISIKMLNKQVTTKFYLSDDAAYDLIEEHLPQLEERLEKLGYHCSISLENREQKVDFVEDFLKSQQPKTAGTAPRGKVRRYSFDVRA